MRVPIRITIQNDPLREIFTIAFNIAEKDQYEHFMGKGSRLLVVKPRDEFQGINPKTLMPDGKTWTAEDLASVLYGMFIQSERK